MKEDTKTYLLGVAAMAVLGFILAVVSAGLTSLLGEWFTIERTAGLLMAAGGITAVVRSAKD